MKSPQFTKTFRWALRLIPVGIALGCGSVIAAASQSQDPNLLVEQGRQLFSKAFKVEEGFGYRLGSSETVIVNRQLGPDAKTCLECHAQGGFGGAGGDRKNVWVDISQRLLRLNSLGQNAFRRFGFALEEPNYGVLRNIVKKVIPSLLRI